MSSVPDHLSSVSPERGRRLPLFLLGALLMVSAASAVIYFYSNSLSDDGQEIQGSGAPNKRLPDVREDAKKAQALSQVDFANPHSVKTAPQIMKSATRAEKLVLISKLKAADTPEAADALEEIVKAAPGEIDPKEDLRGHGIGALVNMKNARAWEALLHLASSEDTKIRSLVTTGLGYSKAEGAATLLKSLAQDPSDQVRSAAEIALAMRKSADRK